MKRRFVAVLLVALAAAGGTGWMLDVPQRLGRVETQVAGLQLYGNIDIRQVRLGFRVSGRLSEVLVEEGDAVIAGTVLARLDAGPLQNEALAAKANVAGLAAKLRELEAGPREAEIARAKANLAEQDAQVTNAETTFERILRLQTSSVYSEASLDQARADRDVARAKRESAREALQLLLEGTRAEDIAVARAELQEGEARLSAAMTALADAELKAPSDGIIVSRVLEPGAIVQIGETVAVLSLVSPVYVRAFVPGPELGRVREGTAVRVISDTFPERPYQGRVGYISPVAEFTPKTVETAELRTNLVYRLRVIVEDSGGTLRQGMPVTVLVPDADAPPAPGS